MNTQRLLQMITITIRRATDNYKWFGLFSAQYWFRPTLFGLLLCAEKGQNWVSIKGRLSGIILPTFIYDSLYNGVKSDCHTLKWYRHLSINV